MKDEYYIQYSSICEDWVLLRIPAWAIELAGEAGEWTNGDGDTYVPSDVASLVSIHKTKAEAEKALAEVQPH